MLVLPALRDRLPDRRRAGRVGNNQENLFAVPASAFAGSGHNGENLFGGQTGIPGGEGVDGFHNVTDIKLSSEGLRKNFSLLFFRFLNDVIRFH